MNGNEAIFNYDPNFLLGFNSGLLTSLCFNKMIANAYCFQLDPINSSIHNLVSTTKTGGTPALEISTLYYPDSSIQGDIYGDTDTLSNFALLGKNLNISSGASGGTWNLPSTYALNPQAQSSYDSSATADYRVRVDQLRNEAETVEAPVLASRTHWYLQGSDINDISNGDKTKLPEGKIWTVEVSGGNGDLRIPDNAIITYHGIGTIVIHGNLIIGKNATILPADVTTDHLGFIISK
jgi:hypothetical protein